MTNPKKMTNQEIQHWMDRWNKLKPSPTRDMVIKMWGGKSTQSVDNKG